MKKLLIIGLCIVAILMFLNYRLEKQNRIMIVPYLPKPRRGMFIPPFGTFIKASEYNDTVIEHENIHYKQYQILGFWGFIVTYLKEYIRYGYNDMPLEKQARTKETEYCKENYTECYK